MMTWRDVVGLGSDVPRTDPTIRSRVFSLIAIVLIPLLLLFAWLAAQFAQSQRRIIEVERLSITSNLTHLLDRQITGIQGVLTGLGNSEALTMGDLSHFKRHAAVVARLPKFSAISLLNTKGDLIFSTAADADIIMLQGNDAADLAQVFAGQPVVSGMRDSKAGVHTFAVTVPVQINDKIEYALSADIRPAVLGGLFKEAGLKPEWVAAIIDRTGRFMARSLSPEERLGHQSTPALTAAAMGRETIGMFENKTLEGLAVGNSFRRSSLSDWTAVVAVPQSILNGPFRKVMSYVVIAGTAITFLSLVLASLMAARISEPVRNLRDTATALIEGRTIAEAPLNIVELNDVRTAFKQAISKSGHLAAIVASSGDAIISVGLDGRVQSWNQGAEHLFGYTAGEMIGRHKDAVVPENRVSELQAHIDTAAAGGNMRSETVRKTRDGKLLDVSLDMAPIRDSDGKVVAMSSIIHDITDRKNAEKHQRFLMRELTHRSKNLLAIVQSMARQTARSAASLKDFETEYMQRLQGLAASHDLLVNQNWTGAPIDELIRRQVAAFAETNGANLAISGPDLIISAKAAQSIGLALHELATNSMKYGALSTPKGKVSIDWEYQQPETGDQHVQIKWEEHNGPTVTPPTRKGFGTFVIERMATQSLSAKVNVDFRPEGLIWTLVAPATALQTEPEFDAGEGDVA